MTTVTSVHAYDVMDQIFVHAVVRTYDGALTEGSELVFDLSTTFPGQGETDPREYLRDALLGLLEAL